MPPKMRAHLANVFPYPPGRPIEEIQREYGLRDVVKLASNENPLGPSPKAVRAIRKCAGRCHLYPDGNAYYLRQALAEKHGVRPEQIVFGAGSDDLNTFIATTFVGPGRSVVVTQGSFIRYLQAAIVSGARVRTVPFKKSGPARSGKLVWRHDVDALLGAVGARTGALCLANPENPVGGMLRQREVARLVRETPDKTLLLLDEAYHEFAVGAPGYPNSLDHVKRRKNVMVTRTFSKAYGLAGLRIGYGISRPEIVEALDRTRPPFNVNRVAQEAALAALDDEEHVEAVRALNAEGMAFYESHFQRLGLPYIESRANFISVDTRRDAQAVFQALLPRGVIVRPLGGYGMPSFLRISIGLPRENKKCVRALEAALREIAEEAG